MKHIVLSIIGLLLINIGVWAQRDYHKGYIITNSQDTVYGWIDYRGDIRNAKVCSFKKSKTDQTTDYTPSEIAAYRYIDSKFYISKNIGNDSLPKQVFLEYLVNGLAKLYYYRADNADASYYIEKDGQLTELKIVKKTVMDKYGTTYISTQKPYIGRLKTVLNVRDMDSQIDKATLEHKSLMNIAKDYHHYACTDGSECIMYEKKPIVLLRIGPVVGVDLSTLKMMGDNAEKYSFDPSTNLTVGINLNLSMPRLNEKIYLQVQGIYSKYYFLGAYQSPSEAIDVQVRSNVLQMGLALKYEYPKGKWRPTLAAGAAAIYLPDGSVKEVTDIYMNNRSLVRESTNTYDFPVKFMYGFEVAPGIHYHLTQRTIVYLQLQYLYNFNRKSLNAPLNKIQSFGLLGGIYF